VNLFFQHSSRAIIFGKKLKIATKLELSGIVREIENGQGNHGKVGKICIIFWQIKIL